MAVKRTAAVLLAALATRLMAQDANGDLLARIRAHMTDTLAQQPNYTCLETVERANRGNREKEFRVQDRIRLEVALVGGKEMFGWPGSKKFESTDVTAFVPEGMFGHGDFALYSKAVFGDAKTQFQFRGTTSLGQRSVTQFDFHVPADPGMTVQSGRLLARVGYSGSIYVDPATLDVVQLNVQADEVPRDLDLGKVTDTLEYARQRIGDSDFLLPSSSEAVMADRHGAASRNHIAFSECREFAGEATLTFGDASTAETAPEAHTAKQEIALPENLSLEIKLLDSIDTDTAAVGDAVRGELNADVKSHGVVLLRKGTPVSGRLIRLEHFSNSTVIGLIFQDAESATGHAVLNLAWDMAMGPPLVTSGTRWGVLSPRRPHEGLIPVRAGHQKVGRNVLLLWRTQGQ